MNGALQLLKNIVPHLVAGHAEFFGVGELQRCIECAPKQHAADKAAQCEKTKAQMRARPACNAPKPQQQILDPGDHRFLTASEG